MKIQFKKTFNKNFEKLGRKLQMKTHEKIGLFQKDPFEETLSNHALIWEYKWFRSIDITGDYRAIFREYPNGTYEFVDFIFVWTHSQLYG